VQNRRDADRLADLLEPLTGELHGLWSEETVLAARDGGTTRDHHEHVVGDELSHDVYHADILRRARIAATDDCGQTANATVDDIVIQGTI
jgi:hypothetical protein